MVDNLTPQDPGAPVQPAVVEEPKQGFLSTTTGKVVTIVGALFAFLVIGGVVALVVTTFFAADVVNDVGQQIAQEAATTGTSSSASKDATVAVAVEPGPVPLNAIFTFRDIFEPLIKPKPTEEASSTTGGTTGGDGTTGDTTGGITGEADTLYLQDVVVENGVPMAVLYYNNSTYTLAAGQSIPNTPWQVLNVYSGSVTMLYGDSQVTLVVGQGVASK